MAKDPILPLYYNDLTTSTQDWTDEEFGAYVRLLIHQWRQGGLPKDYQRLTRLATSLDTTWPLVGTKFMEVDGMLKNPVMEEIREKRARHKEKQSENVRKRYQTSTKPPTKNLPLEDEIENESEKEVKIKKSKLEIFESLFSDEIFIGDLSTTHKGKDLKQAFEECYTHHSNAPNPPQELWEWRQKLNTWLTIKKTEKQNGTRTDKRTTETNARREAFAKRYGTSPPTG